ncbi:sensor histidine kinase [Pedobacter hartonius]|uniref:histidine kinase n=1 Tax=Pedobacter hartonius TaxID=425514 RepID=A0A1H4GYS2_9SPHI|nr:HAMP domain-containing sensor histidine kinase [Pedobacter hartonius]SEB14696.1 Signal transduction histidine kinase [Pedobacter hartonius]
MKLFSSYNRILLVISFAGLFIIGVLFYKTLAYYLDRQIDDGLVEELMEVQDFTHEKNILPAPSYYKDLVVEYKNIIKVLNKSSFADTVYYNPKKKQLEPARYLKTDISLNDKAYQVLIMYSKAHRNEEIRSICLVIIIPFLFLLLVLFWVNKVLIHKLWAPFRQLLVNIKVFNLNHDQSFEPVSTQIQEFKELSNAIEDLSFKVRSDYKEIKLFTENASHEMLTPLAVINSKLDTMLQSARLGPEESETLSDLYKATSRLTKLNQSLLLLVKIDNNLMMDTEEVAVMDMIKEKQAFFQELIHKRNLRIELHLDPVYLIVSRQLFDILINNLFSNAIRHNYEGGLINIKLTETSLSFSNTGKSGLLKEEMIFERFFKDPASDGTGLGLAILKQICSRQQYQLSYHYENQLHIFKVKFNKN